MRTARDLPVGHYPEVSHMKWPVWWRPDAIVVALNRLVYEQRVRDGRDSSR